MAEGDDVVKIKGGGRCSEKLRGYGRVVKFGGAGSTRLGSDGIHSKSKMPKVSL